MLGENFVPRKQQKLGLSMMYKKRAVWLEIRKQKGNA